MSGTVLQFLPDAADDARRLADRLGIAAQAVEMHRFPDGELRVTVGPAAPTTIVYAPLDRPNDKLIAVLFASEALRRGGARRIVLAAPYLCYMRQDTAFHPGEAISQRVIGALLARTVDRVVTVDAHLHRTRSLPDVFPGIEADNLSAMPAIADALRGSLDPRTVVVGPDEESGAWVRDLAGRLERDLAVGRKTRRGDHAVDIIFPDREALRGRPAVLVDDIVSSGATLAVCVRALRAAGVSSVDAVVTHALFPPETMDEFARAGIRSVRSTTSVPHPSNAIRLDAVLADALRREIVA
jgi:ribose-phosphate pyrophosphokinase